jgi:putative PEP-CTERM system histidine kinase
VTASAFATGTAWSYGIAVVGYLAFAGRVALGSRRSLRARLLITALCVTALWAAACASIVLTQSPFGVRASALADALRFAAWFAFLGHLLARPDGTNSATRMSLPVVAVVCVTLIASVALGEGFSVARTLGDAGPRLGYVLRLGLAVFGLILVEQVMRRVQPQVRWAIKPLAVALAGVFGLEVFFYADALLFGQLDPTIWMSRGFANMIVIPFLAIATARNTGWTVDLHLARVAVFHSTALLITGAFLLAAAAAGYIVRYFGGDWGPTLQLELLFAAILFAALVATSGSFRSKLRVFISKHFFSYRYDYREEWLRFTRTLATETVPQSVHERTIKALADLVESPAGALWLRDDARGIAPVARWNAPAIEGGLERCDGALATFLERTGWIVSIDEWQAHPERYQNLARPAWLAALPSPWVIVPLSQGTQFLGFVVLMTPRTRVVIDWEVRDLLKTASSQAAGFLAQLQATESLLEARKFDAFNRMSAFVVHDLKNLVAQLSLMLSNARRHSANPEFQADMLRTVENVVARMNALMLQLRTGAHPVDNPRPVDVQSIVRRVCAAKADARVPVTLDLGVDIPALGHEDRLEHVIGHLVQNAIDASTGTGTPVRIATEADGGFITVVVADGGVGMTPEFVRDRLFKPFQTTKATGMGIGVYESVQYIAGLGGELLIDSEPGAGTRVRVRLPRVDAGAVESSPIEEHAA